MPRKKKSVRSLHHHVYVVQLERAVLDDKKYMEQNPGYYFTPDRPPLYVGMTGLDPDVRFDNHKRGYKHNRFVKKYGLYLRPDLYEHLNPMTYREAVKMEAGLAEELRTKDFAVWQN